MAEKKKSQKSGRNKVKCAQYRLHQIRDKHKIVRVYHSSGMEAALAYAKDKNLRSWATVRLERFTRKANLNVSQQRPERGPEEAVRQSHLSTGSV